MIYKLWLIKRSKTKVQRALGPSQRPTKIIGKEVCNRAHCDSVDIHSVPVFLSVRLVHCDGFFRDESKLVHIHYMKDDMVVHPLFPAYMDHGERVDHSHALGEAVKKKEKQYDSALTMIGALARVVLASGR